MSWSNKSTPLLEITGEDVGTTPWEWDDIWGSGGDFAPDTTSPADGAGSGYYTFTHDGTTTTGYGVVNFVNSGETDLWVAFQLRLPDGNMAVNGTFPVIDLSDGGVGVVRFGVSGNAGSPATQYWASNLGFSNQYGSAPALGEWLSVKIHFVKHATTGSITIEVNGVEEISWTNIDTSGVDPDQLRVGYVSGSVYFASGQTQSYDEIVVQTTDPGTFDVVTLPLPHIIYG